MNIFIPKMYQKDIFSIDYKKIKELGYKLIIFDLDNTIGSIKEEYCSREIADFINNLTKDFIVVVASNSLPSRVSKFCSLLKCESFSLSLKPTLNVVRKIKNKYKVSYQEMVIIGDQILTDIFVGNRKKLLTILVDPIGNIDFKITGFNRYFEKVINKKNNVVRGKYYDKK